MSKVCPYRTVTATNDVDGVNVTVEIFPECMYEKCYFYAHKETWDGIRLREWCERAESELENKG